MMVKATPKTIKRVHPTKQIALITEDEFTIACEKLEAKSIGLDVVPNLALKPECFLSTLYICLEMHRGRVRCVKKQMLLLLPNFNK